MKIVIEGAGEVGTHLAKMLSAEAYDITVVDGDAAKLAQLSSSADVVTVCGDPSSIHTLKEAGADTADLFIAVNPARSQDVNIVSALLAKKLGSKRVTCRIDDEDYLSYENRYLFTDMGIDLMFYPEKIAAGEIAELLRRTASSESMDFARGKLQMGVFRLEDDSPLIDRMVFEFSEKAAEEDLFFRIVAIARGDETIIPSFDTKFRYHDRVYIIAVREGMAKLMHYLGKSDMEVRKLMIVGGGAIGSMVAREVRREMDTVKIIEHDKSRCLQLAEQFGNDVLVVHGDGRNSDLLLEESIRGYDAFVAVTGSSETNILSCVAAKKFGVGRTIAEVENIEYIKLAEDMGVDAIINKKLITAGRIFRFTLSDKVRFVKYMSGTNAEVLEYITAPGSGITRHSLKETGFPKNALIGGVIRGSEAFIAVGDTQIEAYDRVVVFALPEAVKEVDRLFK